MNDLPLLLPVLCVVFIIAGGVIILNLHFHKNLIRQKLAREALISSHQQELLRTSIQVQEAERKRIAANLHDELGAVLSITRMHVVALEALDEKNGSGHAAALQAIKQLTESSLSTMRRISHELMPQNLQLLGLAGALENIAALTNNLNGTTVHVTCPEGLQRLSWPVSLGLYRICLELINNTIRHAQASQANVIIQLKDDLLTLFYADDGIGLAGGYENTGLGHKNIEARTLAMGGTLKKGNNEEGGFYALIKIPQPCT